MLLTHLGVPKTQLVPSSLSKLELAHGRVPYVHHADDSFARDFSVYSPFKLASVEDRVEEVHSRGKQSRTRPAATTPRGHEAERNRDPVALECSAKGFGFWYNPSWFEHDKVMRV